MQCRITYSSKNVLLKVSLLWVIYGCCILQGQAQIGQALHFDGNNDFVDLGNKVFYQNSFTIEGWIRPEYNVNGGDNTLHGKKVFNTTETIFGVRTTDNKTAIFLAVMPNGKLQFLIRNQEGTIGGLNISSNNTVTDGDWHHFAAVKGNDDKLYLYLDGELESTSVNTIPDFGERSNHSLRLGMQLDNQQDDYRTSVSYYYKGLMDEIRFWKSARSENEIQTNMMVNLISASEPNLVSYYQFEQGVANGDNKNILNLTDTKGARTGVLRNFEANGSTSNFVQFYSKVNVALGKGAQTSQISTSTGAAAWAVDGLKGAEGKIQHVGVTQTADADYPWWEIDLGQQYQISDIRIWNRVDNCCWKFLDDLYIMVSLNPIEKNNTVSSPTVFVTPLPHFTQQTELFKNVSINNSGRYVRVFLNKPKFALRLGEVEVFVNEPQNTKNIVADPAPISEGIWFVIQNKSLVDDDLKTPAEGKALMVSADNKLVMDNIPPSGHYDRFLWRTVKKNNEYLLINKAIGWEKSLQFNNNNLTLEYQDLNNLEFRNKMTFALNLADRDKYGTNAYTISTPSMNRYEIKKAIQFNQNTFSEVTLQTSEAKQVWLFQPMELVKGYSIPKSSETIFSKSLELPNGYNIVATSSVSDWAILNANLVYKNLFNSLLSPHLTVLKDKLILKSIVIFSPQDVAALTIHQHLPYLYKYKDEDIIKYKGGEGGSTILISEELMNSTVGGAKREFDQIVHEFAHHIDKGLKLNSPTSSPTGEDREWFPWETQYWFNNAFSEPGWKPENPNNKHTMSSHGELFVKTVFNNDNTWLPPRRLRDRDNTPPPAATNNALHFDGINDFVEIGNTSFHQNSFTVEGWIKPEGAGAIFHVSFNERFSAIYGEVMSNGSMRFLIRNPPNNAGGAYVIGTKNLLDGDWHHFAAVKGDDDKLHLYIDGQLDLSSKNMIRDFLNTDGHKMLIGMNWAGSRRHFKGKMDEVSFWDRARTASEIAAKSKNINTSSRQGLIGYYKFDQGVIDSNNGEISTLEDLQGALIGTLKGFQLLGKTSNFTQGVQ